jgi:hypothetical protein
MLSLGAAVRAETLRVPGDCPTIAAAVERASDGDTVLVEDGVYLESNIAVTKKLLIKSENPYGAVIYGTKRSADAIFIVRAAARIEGFVLKTAATGIKQRHSPDVEWEVTNVVIQGCSTGISMDDVSGNVGSALIRNVAVFGGWPEAVGIATNDAGRIDVSECLITNCGIAFQGYDHLSFRVDNSIVLDCGQAVREATAHRPVPPATSRIEAGRGLRILSAIALKEPGQLESSLAYIREVVFGGKGWEAGAVERTPALDAVVGLTEAGIMLRLADHGPAVRCYKTALAASRIAGSDELAWQALMGLARAAESSGRAIEALTTAGLDRN